MEANPGCPGCCARDARIAELERRLAALEARLGTNSTNSSVPPSANPPGAPKPVVKKKSKRRPGAQPGHPPHVKQWLPSERVRHIRRLLPQRCAGCQAALPSEATPDDPEPTRFQTIELPPLVAVVTEYQGHARTCRACGTLTRAPISAEICAHSLGPRLTSALAYFSGCHGLSKRAIEEIAETVFAAPVALGSVAHVEQEVSAALAQPHAEALAAVRTAAVKHADETSWKLRSQLCWLWGAATTCVAVFLIHGRRSAAALRALLGDELGGILCSDRWSVYEALPAERRQLCWAHLKRDFQKLVDRGGSGAWLGREGLKLVGKVFAAWHAFRDGRSTREQLQAHLAPVDRRMNRVLVQAWLGDNPTVAAFCDNLLRLEPALWTFVTTEGVEPTNNHMERLLRRAVLWRKRSFGCWSETGCRFVERVLTVVQTRRLQGHNVLDYLHDALRAHRAGRPCPTLLPNG